MELPTTFAVGERCRHRVFLAGFDAARGEQISRTKRYQLSNVSRLGGAEVRAETRVEVIHGRCHDGAFCN